MDDHGILLLRRFRLHLPQLPSFSQIIRVLSTPHTFSPPNAPRSALRRALPQPLPHLSPPHALTLQIPSRRRILRHQRSTRQWLPSRRLPLVPRRSAVPCERVWKTVVLDWDRDVGVGYGWERVA